MGRSHALSGVAVGLAVAAIPLPALANLPTGTALLLAALVGGGAVLPDIDHPDATVSKTFGPITWIFAQIVTRVSGGHRNGTHSAAGVSLLALATFGALALHKGVADYALGGLVVTGVLFVLAAPVRLFYGAQGQPYKTRWGTWAAAVFMAAVAVGLLALAAGEGRIVGTITLAAFMILALSALARAVRVPGILDDLLPFPIVYVAVFRQGVDLTLVPWALVLGALVHIVGDSITKGGVPWAWPLSQRNVGPQWWLTGGTAEKVLVAVFAVAITAGLWRLVNPGVGLAVGVVLASVLTATKGKRKRGQAKRRPSGKRKSSRRTPGRRR